MKWSSQEIVMLINFVLGINALYHDLYASPQYDIFISPSAPLISAGKMSGKTMECYFQKPIQSLPPSALPSVEEVLHSLANLPCQYHV